MFFIGALCGAVITLIVFAAFVASADSDVRDENIRYHTTLVRIKTMVDDLTLGPNSRLHGVVAILKDTGS